MNARPLALKCSLVLLGREKLRESNCDTVSTTSGQVGSARLRVLLMHDQRRKLDISNRALGVVSVEQNIPAIFLHG